MVPVDSKIEITKPMPYVSRGGFKLEAGLAAWGLSVNNTLCADVGISTGGFTDCLLQHGASKVYGVDVGKGVVHWKLRQDERVFLLEKTNARYLVKLPEEPSIVVVDASFISLRLLLGVVKGWLNQEGGYILALIKPQFEAGRQDVGKGGVVRSQKVHRQVLKRILDYSVGIGLKPLGLIKSPLVGAAGNVEFLTYLSNQRDDIAVDSEKLIGMIMDNNDV